MKPDAELRGRDAPPRCPVCNKWEAYVGIYDSRGRTLRCRGCLRAVIECRCRYGATVTENDNTTANMRSRFTSGFYFGAAFGLLGGALITTLIQWVS